MEIVNGIVKKITADDVVNGELYFPNDAICLRGTDVTEVEDAVINEVDFNRVEEIITLKTYFKMDRKVFSLCKNAKTIHAPRLMYVKDNQFQALNECVEINLDAALYIGKEGFKDCMKLRTVKIPSITKILNYAFVNCKSLNGVIFPETLVEISEGAFNDTGLMTVLLPGKVKVGESFNFCNDLKRVMVKDYNEISQNCFYGCGALKDIFVFTEFNKKSPKPYTFKGYTYVWHEEPDGIETKTKENYICCEKRETKRYLQCIVKDDDEIYTLENGNCIIKSNSNRIKEMKPKEFLEYMRKNTV